MIRKWGEVIKAKRAQKPECLPYTEKEKKNSAVLNPSPHIVNYSQVMIFWNKWVKKKKKFRNTNTYATTESSAFSIYSKF